MWGKRWKLLSEIKALVESGQVLLVNKMKMEDDSQRCCKTMKEDSEVSH